jgi:hypothetical protein
MIMHVLLKLLHHKHIIYIQIKQGKFHAVVPLLQKTRERKKDTPNTHVQ